MLAVSAEAAWGSASFMATHQTLAASLSTLIMSVALQPLEHI
jgi:hypothetical protein